LLLIITTFASLAFDQSRAKVVPTLCPVVPCPQGRDRDHRAKAKVTMAKLYLYF